MFEIRPNMNYIYAVDAGISKELLSKAQFVLKLWRWKTLLYYSLAMLEVQIIIDQTKLLPLIILTAFLLLSLPLSCGDSPLP